MNDLDLANQFRKQKGKLRTSSDGQKIEMASEQTIDATFAYKHAGKSKGVTAYSFIDVRIPPLLTPPSTIFTGSSSLLVN
jgi:hypothetical protein